MQSDILHSLKDVTKFHDELRFISGSVLRVYKLDIGLKEGYVYISGTCHISGGGEDKKHIIEPFRFRVVSFIELKKKVKDLKKRLIIN